MPTLLNPFKIFLERIKSDALEDHKGSVSIAGRILVNFRLIDNIDLNAEEEDEADGMVTSMDTTCTRYKMKMCPDKTKIMTNNPVDFQRMIKIKGRMHEDVKSFKYLGSVICHERSKPKILSRITQTESYMEEQEHLSCFES